MIEQEPRYWKCMIGPINRSEISVGSDQLLCDSIKNRFLKLFGRPAETYVSSWGVTEEKFNLIREIECYSVDDLRHVITELKMMKDAERANNSI